MKRRAVWRPIWGSVVLTIALLMTMISAPTAAQDSSTTSGQSAGSASVEIHLRSCPTGYSDNNYFQDCHNDPIDGVTFELANLQDTTGADGNVRFFDLRAGTYTITESIPGEFAETVVFCSYGENGNQPASFETEDNGIRLQVPGGAQIVCDWYTIPYNLRGTPGGNGDNGNGDNGNGENGDFPPGASVIIHARICPPGYTGNEPFETCHDNPQTDATFELDGLSATTGQDGNTYFYQLVPQTVSVTQAGQGQFSYFSVFCGVEEDLSQRIDVTYIENGIQLDVPENTDVLCDWYSIPEPGGAPDNGQGNGAQLVIHKSECPAGYQGGAYFEDCHDNRVQGVTFDAYGPEGYIRENVATNAQGIVSFEGVTVGGSLSIREDLPPGTARYVVYCSDGNGNRIPFRYVDTENADGIDVNVSPGDYVLCDWYDIPAA